MGLDFSGGVYGADLKFYGYKIVEKRMMMVLYNTKTLAGYNLHSIDGEVGSVREFYFDDHHWTVRYLVADTGNWLTGRKVLISPYVLSLVNKEKQYIDVDLTQKQIEDSPSLDTDKPVSQQFEESYNGYYGLPMYWNGPSEWGAYPYIERNRVKLTSVNFGGKSWNPNLRSTSVVSGYNIQALDGEIGHVEDFVIDDATWGIRYLVVDTVNWWSGKKVLISPRWIERVSWDMSKVFINLPCEAIRQSPEYLEGSMPTRDYETELHRHYDRQAYWVD